MTNQISRKLFIQLAAFLCILIIHNLAGAQNSKIVYPYDKSIVTVPKVRITGLSNEKNIILKVSNATENIKHDVPVIKQSFNQVISLTSGVNVIESSGAEDKISIYFATKDSAPPGDFFNFYLHSKNELSGKCEQCHNLNIGSEPNYKYIDQKLACITDQCHNNFGEKDFKHGPFAERQCLECHNPHGTINKFFTKQSRAPLCFTCHSELEGIASDGKFVHFPVKKGECLSCHEHHQSNLAYHLKRDTIKDLCLGCHNKSILEHKYMHEPVESGDCNACHSPHTSEFKGLTFQGNNDLCLTCHEVRKEEFEAKYIHEPVAKDCNLCHDPHGSGMIYHLKTEVDKDGKYIEYKKPIMESCLKCHRKLDPEVTSQIETSKVTHKPVDEGKCTICHTPHSTNFKKQLNAPVKELCYVCHADIKELISKSKYLHGPVKTNDCAQCHLVHGSDNKGLLRLPFTDKYSGTFKKKDFDLCFNCHNSEAIFEKETAKTGFRNGNNNLHYEHVTIQKKGRNCKTCHDIHGSDQVKHIRKEIPFKKKFTIDLEYTKTDTGGGCVVGCHKPRQYDREKAVKNKKGSK